MTQYNMYYARFRLFSGTQQFQRPALHNKMAEQKRQRSWCFTLNNFTDEEVASINSINATWLIYAREVGQNGTHHLQGFIHLKDGKTMNAMKKVKGLERAHFESMRGTFADQRVYISKGEQEKEEWIQYKSAGLNYGKNADVWESGQQPLDPKEKGVKGGEKEKARWENTLALAKQGKIDEIDADIQIKYYGTLKKIACDYRTTPPHLSDVCGVWIYGRPGIGKSRFARDFWKGYYTKDHTHWWSGYNNEPAVLLEECDPVNAKDKSKFATMLKLWADRYPFTAEIKGSSLYIRPQRLIVTSNHTIEELWPNASPGLAISRRFISINFDKLLNVADKPTMFRTGADLPYTFDEYDFDRIVRLLGPEFEDPLINFHVDPPVPPKLTLELPVINEEEEEDSNSVLTEYSIPKNKAKRYKRCVFLEDEAECSGDGHSDDDVDSSENTEDRDFIDNVEY